MSTRLPVVETSKWRMVVKVVQIFLAIPVIVSLRSFKSNTSIKVVCGPGATFFNSSIPDLPRTLSARILDDSTNISTSNSTFETFLNYSIKFPFKSPKVFEPLSCNDSIRAVERNVHPSMRVPAMVLLMTASVSSMYCFMYVYAYLNLTSFSKPQIICEVITSILLSFFWFLSSVSWSSAVAHIKHFGTYFMYYSHLCDDPTSSCTKTVSGSSYCSLYLSLIFCFVNFITWFTVTCLRIHSSAFLLFPSYFTSTAQAKFSRVKTGDQSFYSLNNSASQSIATIEDKIEFQRDDFFQALNDSKSQQQLFSARGSISNPNYDPDDSSSDKH